MNNNYQVGDYVKWTTIQGEKQGVVVAMYPNGRDEFYPEPCLTVSLNPDPSGPDNQCTMVMQANITLKVIN